MLFETPRAEGADVILAKVVFTSHKGRCLEHGIEELIRGIDDRRIQPLRDRRREKRPVD